MRAALILPLALALTACEAPPPPDETVAEAFTREAATVAAEADPAPKGPFDFLRRKKKPSVLDGTNITVITDGTAPGEDTEPLP